MKFVKKSKQMRKKERKKKNRQWMTNLRMNKKYHKQIKVAEK